MRSTNAQACVMGAVYASAARALMAVLTSLSLAGAAAAQMAMPGQFAVSPSGAATYTIPIQVPPGVGGLEPKLALTYNSQAGNGLLGVGWSLSGLSSITRCPRTMAQDGVRGSVNFDTNDRYCLDGQRLMAIGGGVDGANGTEYRTEQDGFAKIVSYAETGATNGPGSFIVKTKSGLTMEFGKTEDSRIEAQGRIDDSGHGVVHLWALNRIGDSKGNYYTVSYTEDNLNGQFYPKRIDYTANSYTQFPSNNAIYFDYEGRSDATPQYQVGSVMKLSVRMIRVRIQGAIYNIKYTSTFGGLSALSSVQKCETITNSCLAPIQATYDPSGAGGNNWTVINQPIMNGTVNASPWMNSSPNVRVIQGDFNGDGKIDFLLQCPACGWTMTPIYLSNGDGTFRITNSSILAPGATDASQWQGNASMWMNASGVNIIAGDFNNDGKTDFLLQCPGCSGWAMTAIYLSNGDGTFAVTNRSIMMPGATDASQWSDNASMWMNSSGVKIITGDFNSDGKTDFLLQCPGCSGWTMTAIYLSNGDGTFTIINRPILMPGATDPSQWSSNASMWMNAAGVNVITGDFNGDGKTDFLLQCPGCSGWAMTAIYLSNGDGTFAVKNASILMPGATDPSQWSVNASMWMNYSGVNVISGDFNGDGLTDLLLQCPGCSGWNMTAVYLSKGDATFAVSNQPITYGASNASSWMNSAGVKVVAGDYNGDGKTDFLLQCPGCSGWMMTAVYLSNGDATFSVSNQSIMFGASNASQWMNSAGVNAIAGDYDGDGKTDFLLQCPGCSGWTMTAIYRANAENGNRMVSLQDTGSARSTFFSYAVLGVFGDRTYERSSLSLKPSVLFITPPLVLLRSVGFSDATGSTRTTNYSFGNFLAEVGLNSRGSLGFQWTQSKDASTGLVSRTCYRQDWPYVGLVDKVLTATSETGLPACNAITDLSPLTATGSNLLSLSLNKYTFTATNASGSVVTTCKDGDAATCASSAIAPGKRYQVYGFESYSQSRDWDGTNFIALPANHTTQTQDSWGNVTSVMSETLNADGKTASGYSKTTTNTYLPADTSNWLLGRLQQSQVKAVSP